MKEKQYTVNEILEMNDKQLGELIDDYPFDRIGVLNNEFVVVLEPTSDVFDFMAISIDRKVVQEFYIRQLCETEYYTEFSL